MNEQNGFYFCHSFESAQIAYHTVFCIPVACKFVDSILEWVLQVQSLVTWIAPLKER